MRHVISSVVALVALSVCALSLGISPALAQPDAAPASESRFEFGGSPKYDRPTVAKDAAEKQALAALGEMAKGKWHKRNGKSVIVGTFE